MNRVLLFLLSVSIIFSGCQAMESYTQPTAKVDPGISAELGPYSGPKARVAVAKFEWKVGGSGSSTTTIRGIGAQPVTITHEETGAMTGLRDMLTTALVQSGRYKVLERQEIGSLQDEMALTEQGYTEKASGKKKGKIKGADILVVAAITGWEPGTSGAGGGVGGGTLGIIGGVMGSVKKSSLAMDIRIIDTETSEVLTATRVEGEARDINLAGLAGGFGGGVALVGGLGVYAKTPMEKAIRVAINEATKFIVNNTPKEYMKH